MTEYKFTANYQPKEQPIDISFDELHKELYDKGWTVHWEFNSDIIDPALLKYNDCTTWRQCMTINPNVATDVDENGAWKYRLDNLEIGGSDINTPNERWGLFCLGGDEYGTHHWNYHLKSFTVDLPKLTDGSKMFYYCANLTTFNSDLSSLTNGYKMFFDCRLNTASVKNIADTINSIPDTDGGDGSMGYAEIYIGIGNTTPNAEEEAAFNTMVSKGWTVYVNGDSSSNIWTPTASTNLTEEEQPTPIPFYAKPIQVTDEDEAEYIDTNNNYYNIVGAQFIYGDDLSTYGQFTSFEHAESEIALSLGLTKIEKSI